MGYLHIPNLYRDPTILMFRECYALEKIHGTSAHITWSPDGGLRFSPGGGDAATFRAMFDEAALAESFAAAIGKPATVFGEYYGGKKQKMSATYGPKARFVAFDVRIGESWLVVPAAQSICDKLGIEMVQWEKIPATVEAIDAMRDTDSVQARRNGIGPGRPREGVVLRPLVELTKNNGERVIAKHRRKEFTERQNEPAPGADPARLQVLADADAIAAEWVVPMRLAHVLQKLDPPARTVKDTGRVVRAVTEDVLREADGEIVVTKEARGAIGRKAAELFLALPDVAVP